MSFRTSFRVSVLAVAAVVAMAGINTIPANGDATSPNPTSSPSATATPTTAPSADALTAEYPADFKLTPLSADPINDVAKPEHGAYQTDPAYGTRVYRATNADQTGRMRHEYSRRQAFNADQSRYLAQDTSGHWHLYDGTKFTEISQLDALGGDCEPLWHPTDPNKLYFTGRDGGMQWNVYDIASGTQEVVFDFTGQTPWAAATSFWTKGEGTMSADGRYLALMATSYNESTQEKAIHGLVTLDLQEKKIVGTLDAKDFPVPGAYPDHISTSPSGKYAVPSWLDGQGGTRAYTLDFKESRELAPASEHSDLAFGPNKEDYLVYSDYSRGVISAINLDNGEATDLHTLYPASGEGYALHISGQAFDRPGWAVVSTYADFADYGNTTPAPELRPEYRKVWLMELKPGGRKLNIAHIRGNWSNLSGDDAYFLEPQASASRDLSRIIFASNFGDGATESYIVPIPTKAIDEAPAASEE